MLPKFNLQSISNGEKHEFYANQIYTQCEKWIELRRKRKEIVYMKTERARGEEREAEIWREKKKYHIWEPWN